MVDGDGEGTVGDVAGVVSKLVGDGRHADGEESSGSEWAGQELDGDAGVVDGRGRQPGDDTAGGVGEHRACDVGGAVADRWCLFINYRSD